MKLTADTSTTRGHRGRGLGSESRPPPERTMAAIIMSWSASAFLRPSWSSAALSWSIMAPTSFSRSLVSWKAFSASTLSLSRSGTFCTALAIFSASSAVALACRASAAALPSAASARRVFSLAARMVALMAGIFLMASSAAVLLSFTRWSKADDAVTLHDANGCCWVKKGLIVSGRRSSRSSWYSFSVLSISLSRVFISRL
ncbi:hypothetical protein CRUP_037476 [Coryphaenoides rupestris]|nr:hypothetical protein CRUP_037476 [Coryphaenoides rupestris]